MPGLLQPPQRPMRGSGMLPAQGQGTQARNNMMPQSGFAGMAPPGQGPMGGNQFFLDASVDLMLTDPALDQDIRARARALSAQTKQMTKLLQIGAAMGEDVSGLMPIAQQLEQARQKVFKELIGRANVPTSASKPGKPQMSAPKVNKPNM